LSDRPERAAKIAANHSWARLGWVTAMPLFWKPYKSDVTQFIEELKTKKPTLEEEQRAGRAILWDKRLDLDAEAEYKDARIPQQPYVYQTKV
jgi:hypothetical protein